MHAESCIGKVTRSLPLQCALVVCGTTWFAQNMRGSPEPGQQTSAFIAL